MHRCMTALVAAALLLSAGCQTTPKGAEQTPGIPPETQPERDVRMAWWRAARFGLFIHWGLYAIPAGEWQGETGHAEWIRDTARIPIEEYDRLRYQFNPVKFNADEWVRMAKDAGMQYIVITSKHHDGFCLFDSQFTDYDVLSTPFQRDVLRELADACRRAGLRICWYHSIMDWHDPEYLPRRPWEQRTAEGADFDRYVAHLKNQLRELLTNYGPIGVLWFDGEWEETWNHARGQDLYAYVRRLQPSVIINNRVDKGRNDMQGMTKGAEFAGDFGTPEQEIPATGLAGVDWETCMTMNDHWGYNRSDQNWKSSAELIRKLADVASKGGNFLLNVGPTAEGEFPPASVERLAAIGQWMQVNGAAIHGTQASPFQALPWGRCTQAKLPNGDTRLYLHVFDWPADGALVVAGLSNAARGAYVLADPGRRALHVERIEDALVVRLPSEAPDPIDAVVVLDVAGPPNVVEPPRLSVTTDILVDELEVGATSGRDDLQVRYTTDGSTPTAAAPLVRGPIRITQTTMLKARAFRDGQAVSGVSQGTYTKVTPRPAIEVGATTDGLRYEYCEGDWDRLPDFDYLRVTKSGRVGTIDLAPRGREEYFALRYSGLLRVARAGVYTFWVKSDDGSQLYIGETLVVDNEGLHGAVERAGAIALAAGAHPITVTFFQKTGEVALEVEYAGPGIARQRIPETVLMTP